MDSKIVGGHSFQDGVGSRTTNSGIGVVQTIPDSKKGPKWQRAVMNSLENIGQQQRKKNRHFSDFYKMQQGEFTYAGTGFEDFQEMPWFDTQIRTLREEQGVPTYIKHYDFIGIIVNVLLGIYLDFKDVYRVESKDEYSTNEFIREKTERLQQYATETFQAELQKLLLMRGVDISKNDFENEEEKQAYQQEIDRQKKSMTPEEIEGFMSKNFKVLATEWAQNTLKEDRIRFSLDGMDRLEFIDRLLTGRFFRHYRVGFDHYTAERWRPEEVFFSEDVDARYPQDGEFVGRTHAFSSSDIINLYGHLMNAEQQETVSKYYNQNDYENSASGGSTIESSVKKAFGEDRIVPFKDYYAHDMMKQYESALGVPLGERTLLNSAGEEYTVRDWLPEFGNDESTSTTAYAQAQRSDIEVRTDLIQVTEAYWRSYKRIGFITFKNEQGILSQVIVTDDLLKEFLSDNGIKKLKNVSLEEILRAKLVGNLADYENTIIYQYVPQVWKGIKIRSNSTNLKNDLYLDIRPLDFQIKSNSEFYNFQLPVAGLITGSIAGKLAPYQVLHNICMNQITDILEREIGIFFLMDINYLPSEYKDKGTHEEALLEIMNTAVNTGILPVDMSKQNTNGNQPVNSFQRQDLTYGTQVQYRWQLAMDYKQEAYQQIGITPQLLGQPNSYTTAEGVKQGADASYAQLAPIFDEMNEAKAKASDVHLAVAQWCQSNNRDNATITTNSDGDTYYLDIMKEDGETFPLRRLGVVAATGSKDRAIIKTMKDFILNDNTVTRGLSDAFEVLTDDTITGLKAVAERNKKRIAEETQQQREHEQSMLDKQIKAKAEEASAQNYFLKGLADEKNQTSLEEKRIDATSRVNQKEFNQDGTDAVIEATRDGITNSFKQAELNLKELNINNKNEQEEAKLGNKVQELALKARQLNVQEEGQRLQHQNSIINKN
jgi:hypothetical protein